MKVLIFALVSLMSLAAFSDSEKERKNDRRELRGHPKSLSVFDVIPLNSPVKVSTAKFLLEVPNGFDIDEVRYRVRNASRLFEKDQPHQKINLIDGPQGKELHISVSKLPPGFYKLFVKVRDRKNKEHEFKTKFKDHAMFVIDNSLQVPMPDRLKNNATLLGIDSDNDGVRDDVQRWMNENLNNKPEELKLAFKQYAVAMQASLPTSSNKQASIQSSYLSLRSQDCIYSVTDQLKIDDKEAEEIRQKIKLMSLNTDLRIQARLKASENFHGQEVKSFSKDEACNF